jgi:PAS domain S-box-containing protein
MAIAAPTFKAGRRYSRLWRAEVLAATARRVAAAENPEEGLKAVADALRQVHRVAGCAILSEDHGMLVPVIEQGLEIGLQMLDESWLTTTRGRKYVAYPLIVGGHLEGVLAVPSSESYSADDLDPLLDLAAVALHQGRLGAAHDRDVQVTEAMHQMNVAMGYVTDPVELGQLGATNAARLLGADRAAIWLLDHGTQRLQLLADSPMGSEGHLTIREPHPGVVGAAFSRNATVVIEDCASSDDALTSVRERGVRSALAVPLLVEGRAIGALGCFFDTPRKLVEADAAILMRVAAKVAPMAHARWLADQTEKRQTEMSRRLKQAEGLSEFARQATLGPESTLDIIPAEGCRLLQADLGVLGLTNGDGTITWRASHGFRVDIVPNTQVPRPGSSIPAALKTGHTTIGNHRRFDAPVLQAEGAASWVTVPILQRNRRLGVFCIAWRSDHVLGREDERIIETLASYAGTLIVAEAALREAQERAAQLASVIEQMPSDVVVSDRDGNVVLANDALLQTSDRPILPGRPLHQQMTSGRLLTAYESGEVVIVPHTATIRALGGECIHGREVLAHYRVGDRQSHLVVSAAPVRDMKGLIIGAVTVVSDVTEERSLQRTVAEREARLRTLYDTMACGVVVLDGNGSVYSNKAARLILADHAQTENEPFHELRSEDGSLVQPEAWPTSVALRTGEEQRHRVLGLPLQKGGTRWIQLDAVPLREGEGEAVTTVVASFTDVTDQRRAEQRLQRNDARFRALIENSSDVVFLCDGDGGITYASAAAERITGYSPDFLVGRNGFEFVHPDDADECRRTYETLLKTPGATVSMVYRLKKPDGSWPWMALIATNLLHDPAIRAIVSNHRDITERLEANELLRKNEQLYRGIVEGVQEAICLFDQAGNLEFMNTRAGELFGVNPREVLGTPLTDCFDQETRKVLAAKRKHRFRRMAERYEFTYRLKDGRAIPALVSATPILYEQNTYKANLVLITDLTERKQAQELERRTALLEAENRRYQETNRAKSEVLASMTHELRSPLNAIIGLSELMHQADDSQTLNHRELAGHILASGEHLLRLVGNVLDAAKAEAGKVELHPEELEPAQIAEEVAASLQPVADKAGVTLHLECDTATAFLDPLRLRQVLYNYVSNAIKFTPNRGRVTIRTGGDSDNVHLEVDDTGVGIAADDIPRLFSEFTQIWPAPTKANGAGLGLFITKKLVELQGGSVRVRSEPGKGSTFFAVLPRRSRG